MRHTILLRSFSGWFLSPCEWWDRGRHRLVAFFLATCLPQENATARCASLSYRAENADLIQTPTRANPSQPDQDAADVDRVLGGETAAFESIVRRWQGPLVNMAWRYCRDRGRAEEMAQDALIRAWRGLSSWRRESSFSTWLFALAANVYRNELKRFPTVSLPLEEAPEPTHPAHQHDELYERNLGEGLRRAVLTLPPRYREPVILFYFHEMDLATAAATLRMPEGTMKARLARARDLLRRRFPHLNQQIPSTQPGPTRQPGPGQQARPGPRGPQKGDLL
jgi:RNA polymerase sigma-70 factor (ECF subfamily)